jgi:dimethylhistidine N-methyltransferase
VSRHVAHPSHGAIPGGAEPANARFAADVQYYLTLDPRQLPSRYLYDALGSALFEAICCLPWYGITRAECRLLGAHGAELFRLAESPSTLVELGPGNGTKLRLLLDAATPLRSPVHVHLVDISPTALGNAAKVVGSTPDVHVSIHAASYEEGLNDALRASSRGRTLVMFLGSNIGNFDPPAAAAFLDTIRRSLGEGDALLVGSDLVKPERDLLLAYDDPLGVTAAFNRNLLVRVNRELDGDFNVERFAHQAIWNGAASRVEMHLVARRAQRVQIRAAGIELAIRARERIWTESSYKYRHEEIAEYLRRAGFRVTGQWIDRRDHFALTLGEAA